MHNSFDIEKVDDLYIAHSHNFPEFFGSGKTEEEAWKAMDRKIMHYRDNNEKEFLNRMSDRIKRGLACECGVKLDGSLEMKKGKL